MPHVRLVPEFTFTAERLEQLKQVVPEAFADGKINWDTLRESLGEHLEPEDVSAEHFGLYWPGKREARRLASQPSRGTLLPVPGEGVNEDDTKNLFIEGENLEVLKLLKKAYAGRVKMIYIDPPYNTGNDFVYSDDFTDPLREYLRKTGQLGEEGALTTNTRADGRFHSNWLSMVYPRLRLMRDLLRDDGVLFISIDDNEVHNCRQVVGELFGEENYVETFVWKKSYGGGAKERFAVTQHEYILMYARNKAALPDLWLPPDPAAEGKYYKFRDDHHATRGPYRIKPLEASKSMDKRENLVYAIPVPGGGTVMPKRQWWWKKERTMAALASGGLVFTKSPQGVVVSYKQYLIDDDGDVRGAKPFSVLDGPYTQEGTSDLSTLFDGKVVLQFPKPVNLMKRLILIGAPMRQDHLVLDLFAGSGTTAQAVLEVNHEDGGSRCFLCVQMPEPVEDKAFASLAEIAEERLRRAIKKLKPKAKATPKEDLGFRVFKLAESHYRAWQGYTGDDGEQVQILFDEAENPLVKGWTPEGLLTEVMLLEGFPLDSTVSTLPTAKGTEVRVVTSDHCGHRLLACFERQVKDAALDAIEFEAQDVFVCLDSALTDQAKQRLADRCTLKTI